MAATVAELGVGLILQTGKFYGALDGALAGASRKITGWGMQTSLLISAPLGALIGVTGKFAMEFDQQMRNVNASMRLTEPEFQAMRQRVIDLSMDSRSTAVDIANSLQMVAAAAGEEFDAWKLVEIATHAAGAANSTTMETAQYLIAVMRAYNLTLDDANEIMDRGIYLSQKSGISFNELAANIGRVAPMSALANVSVEEMFGTLRELQMGLGNVDAAVVSYQRILQKILDPTKEMQAIFEAAGYESGMAALQVLGLDGTIRLLSRAVGGNVDKMIQMTGMIQAWRGIAVLMQNDAVGMTESINMMGDAAAYEGAMEAAREQQYMSLSSNIKKMMNVFRALALELWEGPMPVIVSLVEKITELAKGFRGLSDETKQWIVIAVAAGAALGPVLLMLGKILSVASMVAAVALNPLTLALAAVAFAAYKWITARYHIESLADAVMAFSDIAARALNWVAERLSGLTDMIAKMAEWGAAAMGAFAQGIISAVGLVAQAIQFVAGGIASLLAPGSPPAILPDIVKWGMSTIDEYLRGMTMADFDILDDVGDKIADHLRTFDFGGEEALSEALIRARVALGRVIQEASTGGEASADAWNELRGAIHDDTGELEQYLRLRIEASRIDNELATAETNRKRVEKQLEDESFNMQLRHKEELRKADQQVQEAEEALANFREQSAEIPARFTRGRERQLQKELSAAQKERDSIKDRQDIEKDQFEIRKRSIKETLDAQVEAAQKTRNLAKEQADWLEQVIEQKQKIIGLYKEEKDDVEDLGLDLSNLSPEALDISDSIGKIGESTNAAKEAAQKLFGIWKAFWAGLTGQELGKKIELMTEEEQHMYYAGLKVHQGWEKFIGVLETVKTALQPIIDLFRQIFAGEDIGTIDFSKIIQEGGLQGLIDSLIDKIALWLEQKWPTINAKLNAWAERFWGWVSQAIIDLEPKLTELIDKIEEWAYKPETQNRLVRFGTALGEALVDALRFFLRNDAAIAKVLMALTYLLLETLARVLAIAIHVGWDIAVGLIGGIVEKLDPKGWVEDIKFRIMTGLRSIGDAIVQWLTVDLPASLTYPLQCLVDQVAGAFDQLQMLLVGGSIVPDMVADIVGAFGGMRQAVAGEGVGMVQDLAAGMGGQMGGLHGALPGGTMGFGGGALQIVNHWDASISAKDRTELAKEMENTVYGAMGLVYGGAA